MKRTIARRRGWRAPIPEQGEDSIYQLDGAVFYDVHDPERTIVLELDHEHYTRLVIEVEDPRATVALLQSALGRDVAHRG